MTEIAAVGLSSLREIIKRAEYKFELAMEKIENFEQAARACKAELKGLQKRKYY